ncbi:TRAP transporter substrate-binding protein DctP [Arenibaculum sp.]|uniref:TRAP transporter substrate-binding protein DctP n=1 Tax=Arenibaculum sp. TaxID=2865862 RepID=UPI002E0E230F|nr:TRAP transporter substrate-binding protein DctP [Arenibaculum sp.]
MKKLTLAFLGVAMLHAAPAQSAEKWRMITWSGETSIYFQDIAKPFAEKVALLTDGALEIEVIPSGVVAPPFQEFNAVLDGQAEAGFVTPLYVVNRDPANGLLGNVPAGMGSEATLFWLKNGGQDLWTRFRRETMGLHSIVLGVGSTDLIHSHRPIQSVEDLKGLKLRTSGMFGTVLREKFGGAPTTVPFSEIYTLLERRGIDAAEYSTPAENYAVGLHKAARYIITPGFHSPASTLEVIVKQERWDALPADVQEKVRLAADLVTMEAMVKVGTMDLENMAKLRAEGAEFVPLPDEVMQSLREKTREYVFEEAQKQSAAGNPWMATIADSYYGFLDAWEANADYRFTRLAD